MENFQLTEEQLNMAVAYVSEWGLNIIGALIILFIGMRISKIISNLLLKAMRKAKLDETLARFASNMLRYAVMAFTVIAVLSQFGIQTASLIAVMGAAGLAIGLAMQGTLAHIAAGVMLLIFRPFKVGDYITTGSGSGTVEEIGLFFTTLNTPDNVRVIVPNSQLWDSALSNFSANKTRRIDLNVGISYSDNMDKAIKVLLEMVKKDKRTLDKPAEAQVMVSNLGDSSVDLIVRTWVKAGDYWQYKWDMTKGIKETLDKNGISIPFPQRDLHVVYDVKAEKTTPKKKAA